MLSKKEECWKWIDESILFYISTLILVIIFCYFGRMLILLIVGHVKQRNCGVIVLGVDLWVFKDNHIKILDLIPCHLSMVNKRTLTAQFYEINILGLFWHLVSQDGVFRGRFLVRLEKDASSFKNRHFGAKFELIWLIKREIFSAVQSLI